MENSKPNRSKRWLLLAAVFALLAGIGGWRWHIHNQNKWGKINFQTFAPGYLPDKLSVTNREVIADYTPSNNPKRSTMLHLSLGENSYIYEQKSSGNFKYSCNTITNQSCTVERSPKAQPFMLTTTIFPDKSVEQRLEWQRGNTVVQVILHGEKSQPYGTSIPAKIVDGFHAATYQNVPVHYYDHSKV